MKSMILGLTLATFSAQASCPITECNYSDQQYQTASTSWSNCVTGIVNTWTRGMDLLSINYPKFGIAWSAQKSDAANSTNDQATAEAHRRFEDRILNTAEAEALQYYNLFKLKFEQQLKQCGSMPQPPRGQPQ